ncbi:hypothetical protein STCU_04591 [Strigomonas culicis]|uniref:FHA domain-containing protein n=1 Tax=Strigomonas culicis TaxID=28005 RepID=S9UKB3_9TRYP|nr:hypothetical protein STCU_04591 [Strigomonas culicis]|eukprot:EPY29368.1 hypothetical protein STCU_04591 [Strigomonas culicis]
MERPFYGRTGLLDPRHGGLPVSKPRLEALPGPPPLPPPAGGGGTALKWCPDLLTVPQTLLDHLCVREESLPPSYSGYLRGAAVAEALRRRWATRLPRAAVAALRRQALAWCGEHPAAAPTEPLAWYLPDYRLTALKDGAVVHQLPHLARRAVTLCGKDRRVSDLALDHPSCSAQHAALQVQWVLSGSEELDEVARAQWPQTTATPPAEAAVAGACAALLARLLRMEAEEREAGGSLLSMWSLELQLVDLGSTNGTRVNGEPLKPFSPTILMDGDVVQFGLSTRHYVFMQSAAAA